ncbi:spore germination protein KA [Thermoactinomyces sp. DSM 45891]|uniref:spore germination protein n=1 Tax=Thermoactinomyces sp. DSM 45891 TaxID=1761907 RepID=UPI000920AAD7|nr:spore germination protein [Thermoactinomyces sp. DSM 45891]SFX05938.1 spore germination protein KA [Thermoactinomyces sp. DSM 45891]
MEKIRKRKARIPHSQKSLSSSPEAKDVFPSVKENIDYIREQLVHSDDILERDIYFDDRHGKLIFIETLTDKYLIIESILKPLEQAKVGAVEHAITSSDFEIGKSLDKAVNWIISGKCLLFLEGIPEVYVCEASLSIKRGVKEPDNEGIVRGAHDGFIEHLITNIHIIRNRLENPNLVVRYFTLGRKSDTKIALVYMKGLAKEELVEEISRRLNLIPTDFILAPGFIGEYIEDDSYSPFPQLLYTERPDRTIAYLMEGRFAIFSEANPTAIIAPVTLFSFYQSPDDYHSRWMFGSLIRSIRFASFLIAFILPGLYISIVTFHPEVLPIELIYSVKSSIERVPYPSLIEAFFMELTLELIREAGIRLPTRVSQTIGIVGGLVIGDSVVQTGLVSLPMIIVVALTAISAFVVPSHEMSSTVRLLRFPLMIAASMFGFIGMTTGLFLIFTHLAKLETFGNPYFSPVMPFKLKGFKDTFIRFPLWHLNKSTKDSTPDQRNSEKAILGEGRK